MPGSLALKQSRSHYCVARADGGGEQSRKIRSKISRAGFRHSTEVNASKWGKWTLGVGTLIGWTVDLVSGAMRGLETDRVDFELTESPTGGMPGRILGKTAEVGRTLLEMPKDVGDRTAETLLDASMRQPAEQVGLVAPEDRRGIEDYLEGKRETRRLEEASAPGPEVFRETLLSQPADEAAFELDKT